MRRRCESGPRGDRAAVAAAVPRRRRPARAAGRVRATALLAAGLIAGCGGPKPHERPPPTVTVVRIEPQPVTLTTELPGRTSPYEIADVRPQVGGIIQARLFTEGSIVQAGQVLYEIEPAPFKAAYDQAQGQLASAQANLVDTKIKADRLAGLVKLNSVAKQDAD